MDPNTKKDLHGINSGDSDSGLDNASDSWRSGDDEQSATSSDFEDFPNSDNESNSKDKEGNDAKEKNVVNDVQETKVANDVQETKVVNDVQERKVVNDVQETKVANDVQERKVVNDVQERKMDSDSLGKKVDSPLSGKKSSLHGKKPSSSSKKKVAKSSSSNPKKPYHSMTKTSDPSHDDGPSSGNSKKDSRPAPETDDPNSKSSSSSRFKRLSRPFPNKNAAKSDEVPLANSEKVSSKVPNKYATKPDDVLSSANAVNVSSPVPNKYAVKSDEVLSSADPTKVSSPVPVTQTLKPDELFSSSDPEQVSSSVSDVHVTMPTDIVSSAASEKVSSAVPDTHATKPDEASFANAEKASSPVPNSHVAYDDKVPLANGTKEKDTRIEVDHQVPKEYQEVLEFYKSLSMSQSETVDFNMKWSKPEWLDEDKFKRGQKFARDNLFCINFAEMLSLFILFAQKSSLGPLIFTGKSDTPYTSFKRYLSTLNKLMSWYQDDIWNDGDSVGHKNISIVRRMHKTVYHKLTDTSEEELAKKTTLGDSSTTALWCPLRDVLIEDLRNSIQPPHEDLDRYLTKKRVWVNQADMSMTQFGFVGLAVTYPEYFGIYQNSDEDLDAFLHLWRGLGYLLGIKDQYNYCNDSLEAVRRRTKFFLEVVAKPAFRNVTCDWEHMSRCLTAGISFYLPQVNFESAFLYLCHILQINTPKLRKKMSYRSYIVFQVHRFVFYLMKFAGVKNWFNSRLYKIIKKAESTSPEVLNKWENKEYPYMKQEGKCPVRCETVDQIS